MTNHADVALQNVSFGYNGRQVLEDVTLEVSHGDFACIVGPNGGGKTTLMKLLLGLLTPRKGRVVVLGGRAVDARSRVGYIPQHVRFDFDFPVSVFDVVLMGRLRKTRLFGPYSRVDKRIAMACLDQTGLVDQWKRPFSDLSGGQRQRVLIARALACEPELLLLDEPTANLDVVAEQEFYELLKDLNAHMTLIMVSHDFSFVSEYVKTVICVGVGRSVHVHPTRELTDDAVAAVYGRKVRMVRHDDHARCEHPNEEGGRH